MKFVIFFLIFASTICFTKETEVNQQRLLNTIKIAQENIWKEINNQSYWYFPPYAGSFFFSEYYFEIQALNFTGKTKFNQTYFTNLVLKTQMSDGSWQQVYDANLKEGQLDPTIFHYWYLKSIGYDVKHPQMQKAREWIRKNGGIEATQTMGKFKLALFGHYPWEDLWYIPLFIFKKGGIYQYSYAKDIVGQWVYPHLTALAYLRYMKTVIKLGADLKELWLDTKKYDSIKIDERKLPGEPDEDILILIKEMLELRQPKGSFGAYTISTLLSLISLQDFDRRWPNIYTKDVITSKQKGFEFVEFNYFNDLAPYEGTLDDGRWWDTIIISWALLESGEDPTKLDKTMEVLNKEGLSYVGGIAYGFDFEYAPDCDDTGVYLTLLHMAGGYNNTKYAKEIKIATDYLLTQQNQDGGWGAFHVNKTGDNWFYKFIFDFVGIANSAEIFDPSAPDLTAHIIEGFAYTGFGNLNHPVIVKAIDYIKRMQLDFGTWEGRWGINFIYPLGCILPALVKLGYNINEDWITRSIKWLLSKQNKDGGFGESTISYLKPLEYNGVGLSTVTQTSWALMALLEVRDIMDVKESIDQGINFLLKSFDDTGNKFYDISVIGTGHRGILYLQYPAYAYTWPLLTLGRYNKYYYINQKEILQNSKYHKTQNQNTQLKKDL